jgi:3-hydroxyisobutyrate dehydrogenase-like beta-hydroxyacid dehydrogenase
MSLTVAIPVAGAMGGGLGSVLVANGATVLTDVAGRSAATRERAAVAGMTATDAAGLGRADIILSVVPPAIAVETAERLAAPIAAAGGRALYIDANSISPATARLVASIVASTGAAFADGGIIGAPPKPGGSLPSLHVSGPGTERALVLRDFGLDMRPVAGDVGAASALKMCYAAINKGLVGITAAIAHAAEREGAGAALSGLLEENHPAIAARARQSLPDMYPKAYRWVAEMEEIAAFLGPDRPESGIWHALAEVYAELAADSAGDKLAIGLIETFRERIHSKRND